NNGIEPGQVKSIEFAKTTSAHDITDMLGNLPNLKKITKISNLHYSGNGDQMFRDNTVLESVDFKGFDTRKITSMSFMFFNTGFKSLDLSGFDTSQVTSMYGMFDNAGKLSSLNIKNFDTRKVDSMGFMFNNVIAHDLDVSSFNTSNVNNMEGM
ncbi:DUF285 domain-containing protein, partial [Pediococcus acidilactici]|nr:DUF285 domain-containing protein [Pediococcus acidilactici]